MALNKLSKLVICAALLAMVMAAPATFPVLADDGSNPSEQPHDTRTTGIYVKDEFTLPVVQQPKGKPGFVSSVDGAVTQFGQATQYGNIGLLAHNHLAGSEFFDLQLGDHIYVFHGTESIEVFVVTQILEYQALSPNSPHSQFVDLSTGENLTANDLFHKVYTGDRHLTLQTCIESDGEASWGRLFVIAVPLSALAEEVAQ